MSLQVSKKVWGKSTIFERLYVARCDVYKLNVRDGCPGRTVHMYNFVLRIEFRKGFLESSERVLNAITLLLHQCCQQSNEANSDSLVCLQRVHQGPPLQSGISLHFSTKHN